MRIILSSLYFFLSLSLLSGLLSAKPIAVENLFKDFDVPKVSLNPAGTYFSRIKVEEDRRLITLANVDSMLEHELIEFPLEKPVELQDMDWLDNNTLRIFYKIQTTNTNYQAILSIKFKEDGTPYTKAKRISATGYIVSELKDQPGKVLFALRNGRRRDQNYDLYTVSYSALIDDTVSKDGVKFLPKASKSFNIYASDEDRELLSVSYDTDAEKYNIRYLRRGMKKWKLAISLDKDDYNITPIGFFDENTLAVLSNEDSDLRGLYRYDIKTKSLGAVVYAHPKYDLLRAKIHPKTKSVEWVSYVDHGHVTFKYFSEQESLLKSKLDKAFPDQQVVIVQRGLEKDKLLIKVFSSINPGRYYIFNPNNLRAELVADSFSSLDKTLLNVAKSLTVKNKLGQDIESILTLPKTESNGVLLVNPHGGPIGVRDFNYFNRNTQFFVSRGYSVLQVNFRGSSGFGKKFMNDGVGQFGKAIEEDISLSVENVRSEIPFKHVCSMGASYGGYSSVMLAIAKPKLYDCVIASFGIYDLPLIFNSRNVDRVNGSNDGAKKVLGEMRDELWDVSPLYHLEKLQVPLLIIAGEEDKVAPIEQSNRLKLRLTQLGKSFETLFYRNAGHSHYDWFGDWHELTYVDDYIRRTLGIESKYLKEDSELAAETYALLADGLDDDEFLPQDSEKSLSYYRKAAKLGHARSQFNVARFYHRGVGVDQDWEQAEAWYQKSANNGYNDANIVLGRLNYRGVFKQSSKAKALDYFKTAHEKGEPLAGVYSARSMCLGQGGSMDIEACLTNLEKIVVTDTERMGSSKKFLRDFHDVIAEISWLAPLQAKHIERVKLILGNTANIEIFSSRIREVETGLFLKHDLDLLEHSSDETHLPLKKGMVIGSTLKISASPNSRKNIEKVLAVRYKWTSPLTQDDTGAPVTPEYKLSITQYDLSYYFTKELEEDWQLKEGRWTLEVETLDGESLYKQEFDLFLPTVN